MESTNQDNSSIKPEIYIYIYFLLRRTAQTAAEDETDEVSLMSPRAAKTSPRRALMGERNVPQ